MADVPKPESSFVVDQLKKQGIQIYILSGDHPTTVNHIAATIGIDNTNGSYCIGGLTPQEKANKIRELQEKEGKIVAMVGDGMNDCISLVQVRLLIIMIYITLDQTH